MKSYKILLLVLILAAGNSLFSQNSETAGMIYGDALALYYEEKPQEAFSEFIKAINEESKLDNPDHNFLGECYKYAAENKAELIEYVPAIDYCNKSLDEYRMADNEYEIGILIPVLASYYSNLRWYDQSLPYPEQEFKKTWVAFSVDSVFGITNDTMWVIIDGGDNFRITPGGKGNAYSIYTTGNPDRGNVVLGSAWHYKSNDNAAICFVVLSNTNDPAYQVKKGDMIELPCKLPVHDETFLLSRIAQLDVQFYDLEGTPIFDQLEMLYNTDPQLEDDILNLMVNNIYETWGYMQVYVDDYPSWIEPMEGGKYEGVSLLGALEITTRADIDAFLNFMNSYPGKYMGHQWNLIETFATWLINFTPLGEFDQRMYKRILELEGEELDQYVLQNVFYIQDSTLEKFNAYFNEELNNNHFEQAEILINKFIRVADILGNNAYKSVFLVGKGNVRTYQEQWLESIKEFDEAIEIDPYNLNAYFFRGFAYGQLENYYLAVKDYKKLTELSPELAIGYGNQGWYLLLDGKIFEARKICKKAYDLDSTQLSYAVNVGHSYLLMGDTAKAMKYYDKTLELLTGRSEFWTGPAADFDIFIKNDWQSDLVRAAKDYMVKRFREDYEYYALADSIATEALALKDIGDYRNAVKLMLQSYTYEQESKNPRPYWLYWETSWIGYMYQEIRDWELAEKYYFDCLHYANDVLDDDSKTANAFDLLSWMYGEWGKQTEYVTYKEKSEAYLKKYDEINKTRRLYLLAVGNNEFDKLKYNYADQDVSGLASVFRYDASGYYDSIAIITLVDKEVTFENIENSFRDIITDSRPDDIFVFYLGGTGSLDTTSFRFYVPRSDSVETRISLEVNTIKTWLSSVEARNQFLVLDIFAPTFIDEFVGNYAISRGALAGSNLNLSILSLTGHRIEDDLIEHGVLSHSIIELLQQGSEQHSAQDKNLSIKDLNAHLFTSKQNDDNIISWNTYHTGDDFVLMNYDSLQIAGRNVRMITPDHRGVGSLYAELDEEGSYTEERKNYALIFATDEYDEWSDLVNPVFDATAMAKTLEEFYNFEVELLTNNTRMDVLTKIREYQKKQFGPDDQLFVFFAGHGSFDDISGEGYIVCRDSKKDDEIRASYIPYSYLRENVNNIKRCDHILIALDVCFGGTFDKKLASSARGDDVYDKISKEEFISRALEYKTRLFITSGGKEYVSDGEPGKHSPFAYQILSALRTEGMVNGFVTFHTLVIAVGRSQTNPRYGNFGDNEPGSEFVFSIEVEEPKKAFRDKGFNKSLQDN